MTSVLWSAPAGTQYWTIVLNPQEANRVDYPVGWIGTANIHLGPGGKSVRKVTYQYPGEMLQPSDNNYKVLVDYITKLVSAGSQLAIWKAPQNDKDIWYIVFLVSDMEDDDDEPFDMGDLLKTKRSTK